MPFFKRKSIKAFSVSFSLLTVAALILLALPGDAVAQLPSLDPNLVRNAVRQMGMDSLSSVILTDPPGLTGFERITPPVADALTNPPTPAPPASLVNYATAHGITVQRAAMQILGKSLFWDQQIGSDGQACASCHFAAGSDIRSINSLNPGARNTDATERVTWNPTASGGTGGPNYQLTAADFPFYQLTDPLQTNYENREVQFDTDDVVGSIGTYHAAYAGSPAPDYTVANARGTYDAKTDITPLDIFNVGGVRTRSNGPRQAAPTINAVFNFNNFWDGRADNNFNGLNMHGIKDLNAFIYFNAGGVLIHDLIAGPGDSALASQATAPVFSGTSDEMAFAGRTMEDVGRKIFRLTGPAKGATATATIDTSSANSTTYQQVIGITITAGGSGYVPTTAQGGGATLIISGGGGAGATATVTVNGSGVVVNPVTIVNPGGGYVTPPTVTVMSNGLDAAAYTSYTDGIIPVIIPLGAQLVDATDSLLGNGTAATGSWTFKNTAGVNGGRGINMSYANLVQWAFQPTFWDGAGVDALALP